MVVSTGIGTKAVSSSTGNGPDITHLFKFPKQKQGSIERTCCGNKLSTKGENSSGGTYFKRPWSPPKRKRQLWNENIPN